MGEYNTVMMPGKQIILILILILMMPLLGAGSKRLCLPKRCDNAPGGAVIAGIIADMPLSEREEFILQEVVQGNVPVFLRTLQPVQIEGMMNDKEYTITYWVIPDYFAVGGNEDYFYVPMTPRLAQILADKLSCSLPTALMVRQIWQAAPCKLEPQPLKPAPEMINVSFFKKHNSLLQKSRREKLSEYPLGTLTAGHKKDVILHNRALSYDSNRVILYGWHKKDGLPIQPVSGIHSWNYVDYSHGIRFVYEKIMVNDEEYMLVNVLQDNDLASFLNEDGILKFLRYPSELSY